MKFIITIIICFCRMIFFGQSNLNNVEVKTLVKFGFGNKDGLFDEAQVNGPSEIVVDTKDNIYISDYRNRTIRKIVPIAGTISTELFYVTENKLLKKTFFPTYYSKVLAFDKNYNLYIAAKGVIFKSDNENNLSIVSEGNHTSYIRPGTPKTISNIDITAIKFDRNDNLLVVSGQILKIDNRGIVSDFTIQYSEPENLISNNLLNLGVFYPNYIEVNSIGDIFLSSNNYPFIVKISNDSSKATIFAGGKLIGLKDGVRGEARFKSPGGLVVDEYDNLYVCDTYNHAIRKITSSGVVTTIAGGTFGFEDGFGKTAKFQGPTAIAYNKDTNSLYVCDMGNNAIRTIKLESGK